MIVGHRGDALVRILHLSLKAHALNIMIMIIILMAN